VVHDVVAGVAHFAGGVDQVLSRLQHEQQKKYHTRHRCAANLKPMKLGIIELTSVGE